MNREIITARLGDWEARLTRLCSEIDAWAKDIPEVDEVQPDTVTQRTEDIMRKFGVEPRQLPTRAVIVGKHRISFVPSALWVVGANGRVNVTTTHGNHQMLLLDMGGQGELPSNWQLASSRVDLDFLSFGPDVFRDLVLGTIFTSSPS